MKTQASPSAQPLAGDTRRCCRLLGRLVGRPASAFSCAASATRVKP